jgi:hypothetical protein
MKPRYWIYPVLDGSQWAVEDRKTELRVCYYFSQANAQAKADRLNRAEINKARIEKSKSAWGRETRNEPCYTGSGPNPFDPQSYD